MSELLNPIGVIQALQRGEQIEIKFSSKHSWEDVLPSEMNLGQLINPEHDFRVKPEMITIGDVSFPKPESEKPKPYTKYFFPCFVEASLIDFFDWTEDKTDYKLLKAGLIHLTRENAVAHAKALIKLSGGSYE